MTAKIASVFPLPYNMAIHLLHLKCSIYLSHTPTPGIGLFCKLLWSLECGRCDGMPYLAKSSRGIMLMLLFLCHENNSDLAC